jgi:uncharacterized protein YyaL (SSP411 family)
VANRLAGEQSPYLLQHKDNPVDWRPWGEDAFKAARDADKPILLSIGYSTCHWCHVMERESFSSPEVAEHMNRDFICVKLDREERPDVDKIYMTAVQAMTGQGGWPLNVFLTPDLKPFFGGTYFPPAARWGQPGWIQLLGRIAELWRTRRKDILSDAAKLSQSVAEHVAFAASKTGRPGQETLSQAEEAFASAYDNETAGFGGAPKFPMPSYQRFLLRRAARSSDPRCRSMAVESLRAMARGGIFDQVGGGFHRYSTDAEWRVPHFEKMLYDNAQLLENLADALLGGADEELSRALNRTVAYLRRDLRSPAGGFFSAEDADSLPPELAGKASNASHEHKEEGAFYLWTDAELKALLGELSPDFSARYGIEKNGNAPADPHDEFGGKNIPYDRDPAALAEPKAAKARGVLLAARAKRPRPALDDKCLASWNGLVLSGLSRAHIATRDPQLLELARGAADFLRREMSDESGGGLWHRWRDGHRAISGFADDYAYVAQGLFDLYEASFDTERLRWSLRLTEEAIARFGAPGGGLYQTGVADGRELFARALEDHDGVEPSPSAVLADVALRLYELTGRDVLRAWAEETLERFAPRMRERPTAAAYMLCALDRGLGRPKTTVIAGYDLPGGAELLAVVRAKLRPDLIVAGYNKESKAALAELLPAVAAMPALPRAAAYVCTGRACGLPIFERADLVGRLDAA